MNNESRKVYETYLAKVAKANNVANPEKQFSVVPGVQQTLEQKIQESSSFLSRVNLVGVPELSGQKIYMGASRPVAGRTNTDIKARETKSVGSLDDENYQLVGIDYDSHITYQQIDAWAKFPAFATMMRNVVVQQQARDRIMIGFNGTHAAADTDIVANPRLQDVAKGWLQKIRDHATAKSTGRWMHEAAHGSGKIEVGAGGDYENLDALVKDGIELLDEWYREDPDLVVILGRGLMHDKYFPLINQTNRPTDMLALDLVVSQKRVGGLPAVTVPFFPAGAVLITTLNNLSIYYQDGARRRYVREAPERRRIENFESSNDDYIVESQGRAALLENIELV